MATSDLKCFWCGGAHLGIECDSVYKPTTFGNWGSSTPLTAEQVAKAVAQIKQSCQPQDDLASARAEIERLTKDRDRLAESNSKAQSGAFEVLKTCQDKFVLLERAFAFLCSLSPHFNQPALSQQGKRERDAYAALVREMKQALSPALVKPHSGQGGGSGGGAVIVWDTKPVFKEGK